MYKYFVFLVLFVFTIETYFVYKICVTLVYKHYTLEYRGATIGSLLPYVVITITFVPLIANLNKYHHFEYHRIKTNMIVFYFGEL
jgi:hypothetical protein